VGVPRIYGPAAGDSDNDSFFARDWLNRVLNFKWLAIHPVTR